VIVRYRSSRRASFEYPAGQAPKTAILVPWFAGPGLFSRARTSVRNFPGWTKEAVAFAPAAIAATSAQLLALTPDPPRLTHALICLACPNEMLLTAADRDQLWRAFRVPIFEQVIGPRGQRLAAECAAHNGLHIEAPARDWSAFAMDVGLCACGLRTPRISSPQPAERVRAVAVFAR
jgi:hypothetical protein